MDHVAIMKKSWGLIPKIISGEKTIESRWYKSKIAPWDRINVGDVVYFKNSGENITVKATVSKVQQFDLKALAENSLFALAKTKQEIVEDIYNKYGKDIGLEVLNREELINTNLNKNYCILVFLKSPKKINPFRINKTGFGCSCAWITINDISRLKIN